MSQVDTSQASEASKDIFMAMAVKDREVKSLENFQNTVYRAVPVSEISKTQIMGSALLIDNPDKSMEENCLKISKTPMEIVMQPAEFAQKLSSLFETDLFTISNRKHNISIVFKQDDIDLMGDKYGNYIDVNFDPTGNYVKVNSMVGRYICTNGATVEVSSRIPHWKTFRIKDIQEYTPEQIKDEFYTHNTKYITALMSAYDYLASVSLTKDEFKDKIVTTAMDLASPQVIISDLDRAVLSTEDPQGLLELQNKAQKSNERRQIIEKGLIDNYEKNDTDYFANTLYRAFLALSDAETHGVFRDPYAGYRTFVRGLMITAAIMKRAGYRIRTI